jgi:alkylhydroperoxidase family enzyme
MFLNKGDVDDATFQDLAAHFSPQEIVELSVCASYYFANAYVVNALRLQADEPGDTSAPGRF